MTPALPMDIAEASDEPAPDTEPAVMPVCVTPERSMTPADPIDKADISPLPAPDTVPAVIPWLPMSLRSMMPADPIPIEDISPLFTARPAAVPCVGVGEGAHQQEL